MSAPDTDPEKQERRHKAPLLGMKGVIIFVALILVGVAIYSTTQSDDAATEALGDSTPTVDVTGDSVPTVDATDDNAVTTVDQ